MNRDKVISINKKVILTILCICFIGLLSFFVITKSDNKRDKLLTEIAKYQIQQSTQKTMKNFDITSFSDEYTANCPIYIPFIYYSLNPKIEFLGVDGQQGETVYTFFDNRYLNFGYYDPSDMGKDEPIRPIFYDHNDLRQKTPQEVAEMVNLKYCKPIMLALEKYKDLPIPEIVKNMRKDIWGKHLANLVEQIENVFTSPESHSLEETENAFLLSFRQEYKARCIESAYKNPPQNLDNIHNFDNYVECFCSTFGENFSTEDIKYLIANGEPSFLQTSRGANLLKQTTSKCKGL